MQKGIIKIYDKNKYQEPNHYANLTCGKIYTLGINECRGEVTSEALAESP